MWNQSKYVQLSSTIASDATASVFERTCVRVCVCTCLMCNWRHGMAWPSVCISDAGTNNNLHECNALFSYTLQDAQLFLLFTLSLWLTCFLRARCIGIEICPPHTHRHTHHPTQNAFHHIEKTLEKIPCAAVHFQPPVNNLSFFFFGIPVGDRARIGDLESEIHRKTKYRRQSTDSTCGRRVTRPTDENHIPKLREKKVLGQKAAKISIDLAFAPKKRKSN